MAPKTQMKGEALFNKLWVIESLPHDDLKTGFHLVNDQLAHAKFTNEKLKVVHETPTTKDDFFKVLEKIRLDIVENQNFPMIHIDCHGSTYGLSMANNEQIEWDELRNILIDINIACRLNLVIVLASCNGAYLINVASKLDKAPFWAFIGSDKEITAGSVEENFGAFYTDFFNTLSGDAAIAALNQGHGPEDREYYFFSAMGLWVKAYKKYHLSHCVGKPKKVRIEYLLTEALKNPATKKRGIGWARKQIKSQLGNNEEYFNKYLARFFMHDLFEENKKRFSLSYDDFINTYCNP